jgi:trigger factor
MLDTLRKQRPVFTEVERAAAANDRVTVDFTGTIDGLGFDGGNGVAVPIVIGSGRVMKEFEDALIGAKSGDTREFQATFASDHSNPKLAGKSATFKVNVGKVEEQSIAPIDEEFAKSFGIADGNVDSLRNEVRANMERELNEAIRQKMRGQVLEALYAQNPLELPRQLVDEQIQELQAEMLRRAGVRDAKQLPPREPFEPPARRRVALGLILNELVRSTGIKVSRESVMEKLNELAASYSNPDEVRRTYLQNSEMMRQIESQVLEQQAIDWVLGQAKLTEKSATFSEITRFGQGEA